MSGAARPHVRTLSTRAHGMAKTAECTQDQIADYLVTLAERVRDGRACVADAKQVFGDAYTTLTFRVYVPVYSFSADDRAIADASSVVHGSTSETAGDQ